MRSNQKIFHVNRFFANLPCVKVFAPFLFLLFFGLIDPKKFQYLHSSVNWKTKSIKIFAFFNDICIHNDD
jgi:hypothetical protein